MNMKENIINSQLDSYEYEISTYCGAVIKRIRKKHRMSGNELARRINVSQQQMSRYERGINKISLDTLFNLSIALNVPFEKIIKYILIEMEESNSEDAIFLKRIISSFNATYFY